MTIQVFDEIQRQDDALLAWCKERKDLFTDVSDEQIACLQDIVARHPRIATKGTRNFADRRIPTQKNAR